MKDLDDGPSRTEYYGIISNNRYLRYTIINDTIGICYLDYPRPPAISYLDYPRPP